MKKDSLDEKAALQYTQMLIEQLQKMEASNWEKPWLTDGSTSLPRNINGREYTGSNVLMLMLECSKNHRELPVYMTVPQANAEGVRIKKGEKGFPISLWKPIIMDKEGKRIDQRTYDEMTMEQKAECRVTGFPRYFHVYNVDQTNLREVKPELWEKLKEQTCPAVKLKDENDMFKSPELDYMLENQTWLCPVHAQNSNSAYYDPSSDSITVPIKAQFTDGESFYTTLLHEMAHSTGSEERLKREMNTDRASGLYAREELVAELSAALASIRLGISKTIKDESKQYIKSWLDAISQEPKFLMTVMSDAVRAVNMINETVMSEEMKTAVRNEAIESINSFMEEKNEEQQNRIPTVKAGELSTSIRPQSRGEENGETQEEVQTEAQTEADAVSVEQPELQPGEPESPVQEVRENIYYVSVAFLQMSSDTQRLDELHEARDYDALLDEAAATYDEGLEIDLEHAYLNPEQNRGDDLLNENEHYAIVYNNSVGGTYDLMRKVPESRVWDMIRSNGLPVRSNPDIEALADRKMMEEFASHPDISHDLEMPNGRVLQWEMDFDRKTFNVGKQTEEGMSIEYYCNYIRYENLEENLQEIKEMLSRLKENRSLEEGQSVSLDDDAVEDQKVANEREAAYRELAQAINNDDLTFSAAAGILFERGLFEARPTAEETQVILHSYLNEAKQQIDPRYNPLFGDYGEWKEKVDEVDRINRLSDLAIRDGKKDYYILQEGEYANRKGDMVQLWLTPDEIQWDADNRRRFMGHELMDYGTALEKGLQIYRNFFSADEYRQEAERNEVNEVDVADELEESRQENGVEESPATFQVDEKALMAATNIGIKVSLRDFAIGLRPTRRRIAVGLAGELMIAKSMQKFDERIRPHGYQMDDKALNAMWAARTAYDKGDIAINDLVNAIEAGLPREEKAEQEQSRDQGESASVHSESSEDLQQQPSKVDSAMDSFKQLMDTIHKNRRPDIAPKEWDSLVARLTDDELQEAVKFNERRKGRSDFAKSNVTVMKKVLESEVQERRWAGDTGKAEKEGYEMGYAVLEQKRMKPGFTSLVKDYTAMHEKALQVAEEKGKVGTAAYEQGAVRAGHHMAVEEQVKAEAAQEQEQKQGSGLSAADVPHGLDPFLLTYYNMKKEHPDNLVFIKDGHENFYALFKEDAERASSVWDIPVRQDTRLVDRDGSLVKALVFPESQLDKLLPEAFNAGYRVSLTEGGERDSHVLKSMFNESQGNTRNQAVMEENQRNINQSLADRLTKGIIDLRQASIDLYRSGWFNSIPSNGETRDYLSKYATPEQVGQWKDSLQEQAEVAFVPERGHIDVKLGDQTIAVIQSNRLVDWKGDRYFADRSVFEQVEAMRGSGNAVVVQDDVKYLSLAPLHPADYLYENVYQLFQGPVSLETVNDVKMAVTPGGKVVAQGSGIEGVKDNTPDFQAEIDERTEMYLKGYKQRVMNAVFRGDTKAVEEQRNNYLRIEQFKYQESYDPKAAAMRIDQVIKSAESLKREREAAQDKLQGQAQAQVQKPETPKQEPARIPVPREHSISVFMLRDGHLGINETRDGVRTATRRLSDEDAAMYKEALHSPTPNAVQTVSAALAEKYLHGPSMVRSAGTGLSPVAPEVRQRISDPQVVKMQDGRHYSIRTRIDGEQQMGKQMSYADVSAFFDGFSGLTKEEQGERKAQVAAKYFSEELSRDRSQEQDRGMHR